MTKKNKSKIPDKPPKKLESSLDELEIPYITRIRIFDSIEEMESHHQKLAADKDPVQGLKETVELILRTYGLTRADLKNRIPDNSIKIKYYR